MFESVIAAAKALSILEISAVILAIIYVILAAKKNILCWLAAFLSSSLYLVLCIQSKLYAESGLQVFYIAMAVLGFINWNSAKRKDKVLLRKWAIRSHLINVIASLLISIVLGYLLSVYTDANLPYLDSFTTVFSLVATFLVVYRIVENWLYWIVIDLAAVYLYFSRDFHLTSLLFVAYVILSIIGFISWNKAYKNQKNDLHHRS